MLENMVVTDEMHQALDIIHNDEDFKVLFVTGKAGTGKTVFLDYLREQLDNVAVVAPTGIAALNCGGVTIHSFFKFGIGFIDRNDIKKAKNPGVYQKLEYLIIDEISMVRSDMFDGINKCLQRNRDRKNEAFGGVKIIMFGDLCQLPPVVTGDDRIALEHHNYESPYFFGSKIFKSMRSSFRYIEFTRIFRQDDLSFKKLLEAVRTNTVTKDDYDHLKTRVIALHEMKEIPEKNMILCSTNAIANNYNLQFLRSIQDEPTFYNAKVWGKYRESEYPTSDILELRVDAQVMFIKNDPDGRWVNGTIGFVNECHRNHVMIETDTGVHKVEELSWDKTEYRVVNGELVAEQVGKFTQMPLKLGWAVTIHKSQGLTFDDVYIDTGNGVFASGQLYVALSRCRTFEGIRLKNPIRPQDMIVNKELAMFNRRLAELNNGQRKEV